MIDLGEMKRNINLTAPTEKLRELHDKATEFLKPMDTEDQQLTLLILERLVLGKEGHQATVKFGKNVWSGKKCSVCGVPLQAEGDAVWIISRWENSSVMLCLCDTHAQETLEVDIDILTGKLKSQSVHA